MKDIEWAKEQFKDDGYYDVGNIRRILDKIEEPELPVIPQFVADDYQKMKEIQFDWTGQMRFWLGETGVPFPKASEDSQFWMSEMPIEDVVQITKGNFKVKKEPLFKIPLADGFYVGKNIEGKVTLFDSKGENWAEDELPKLTAKEIDEFDKGYWAFAVPIKEENE